MFSQLRKGMSFHMSVPVGTAIHLWQVSSYQVQPGIKDDFCEVYFVSDSAEVNVVV